MATGLKRPWWWVGDFDDTGKTQLGWAKEAAAAYRAKEAGAAPARPADKEAKFRALKAKTGVTPSVTPPVTPGVTPHGADTATERKRRWREQNKERSREINRAAKVKQRTPPAGA